MGSDSSVIRSFFARYWLKRSLPKAIAKLSFSICVEFFSVDDIIRYANATSHPFWSSAVLACIALQSDFNKFGTEWLTTISLTEFQPVQINAVMITQWCFFGCELAQRLSYL